MKERKTKSLAQAPWGSVRFNGAAPVKERKTEDLLERQLHDHHASMGPLR